MFPTNDIVSGRLKYSGRSKAVVIDNVDPEARGRIRVDHPNLGQTAWIDYLQVPGSFHVPDKGDIVYIEADAGYHEYPIAWGSVVKGAKGDAQLPEAFKRNKPTNKGFYSVSGHLFELDDGSFPANDTSGVRITSAVGNTIHINDFDSTIKLDCSSGQSLQMGSTIGILADNATGVSLALANSTGKFESNGTFVIVEPSGFEITDAAGNTVVSDPSSITVQTASGNIVLLAPSGIEITDVAGNKIVMGPTGIELVASVNLKLTAAAGEVLDVIVQLLTALTIETPAGFSAPLTQLAKYTELLTIATAIKG